jgi:hypothetical protein
MHVTHDGSKWVYVPYFDGYVALKVYVTHEDMIKGDAMMGSGIDTALKMVDSSNI